MNRELKMKVHEMIENATQALKRCDNNDDHWKVLLSLLRFNAEAFIPMFEEFEEGEKNNYQCCSCEAFFNIPNDDDQCPHCFSGNWVEGAIDDSLGEKE